MASYRGKDVQMKNRGGTIKIMEMVIPEESRPGEWLNIRALRYDAAAIVKLNFTVSVNVSAYNAWYKTDPFNAGGSPPSSQGSSGGYCSADWSEGCSGSQCNGADSNADEEECNQTGRLACVFKGGSWNASNCTCSTTASGTVAITSPSNNATVGGVVTVTATFNGTGVKDVEFFVGNSLSLGKDTSPTTFV